MVTVGSGASRAALLRELEKIPRAALGSSDAARAILTRAGLAILGRIRRAFVTKARGGTDEAGDRWAPLSPGTVARGRRAGRTAASERQRLRRDTKKLTAAQARWWRLYQSALAGYGGNREAARKRAWFGMTGERPQTILSKYGGAQVEILRDTGLLLNSLSPGTSSPEQVFRVGAGSVIIGTNRRGAAAHHGGVPARNLPRRRLWPEPARWPQSWWDDAAEAVRDGLAALALEILKGA